MTTYTITAELLQELISNCMASIAEDGISDARRVYRTDLHHRANLAMCNLQPNTQGSMTPNDDHVICPQCVHHFRAIPVNVQQLMLDAGFVPPFTHPASQTKPLTNEQINDLMQEADAKWSDADVHMHWARQFARAIEAAHGVKP